MEVQLGLAISFVVMIGLNALAATLVWAEYNSNRSAYLKSVAIGQTAALIWHLLSLWITFDTSNVFLYHLSACSIFISALYFLSAALHDRGIASARLIAISAAFSAIMLVDYVLPWLMINWLWFVIMGVLIATPFATLLNLKDNLRWLVAGLQLAIAFSISVGIILLSTEYQELGGVLYFTAAILVPMLAITYIIISVRLSRIEIAEKERDYRIFFDSINEVFFKSDIEGFITEASPSIEQFGFRTENFLHSYLADYLFDPDTFRQKLQVSLERNEPFEYSGSFRANAEFVECEIVASPITDKKSGSVYLAGAIRNTHERTLLEQQFINAERDKSLGILAGGIAHDFNNILQGVVSHAEILQLKGDLAQEARDKSLKAILNAAGSAASLCRQLLHYTGRGISEKEDINLLEALHGVIDIINPSHLGDVEFKLDLPTTPAFIHGDHSQISQVFLNILKNAIDAVQEKGRITISMETISIDSAQHSELLLLRDIHEGTYQVVSISDDGAGIPEEVQSQMFDPFFTTKPKGHGLGLAAVTGILKSHHGEVIVNSSAESGTTFKIFLPAIEAPAAQENENIDSRIDGGKLILLVDDNKEIRSATSVILTNAGNQVMTAQDGDEALDVYKNSTAEINLVISDIKMPKMDGITLARKLRECSPALPIILTTGYAELSDEVIEEEAAKYQFINKPFRAEDLLSTISQLND